MSELLVLWVVQLFHTEFPLGSDGYGGGRVTLKEQHVFDTEIEADDYTELMSKPKWLINDDLAWKHRILIKKFTSTNHCDPQKMMRTAMDRVSEEAIRRNKKDS